MSDTDLCMESLVELELAAGDMEQSEKGKDMFITPTSTRNRDTDLNMVKLRML